jgi:hypothetical protein
MFQRRRAADGLLLSADSPCRDGSVWPAITRPGGGGRCLGPLFLPHHNHAQNHNGCDERRREPIGMEGAFS